MTKHRIAYENAVANREDLERIYGASVSSGSLPTPKKDAQTFAKKFSELYGKGAPKCGWEDLAKELRLIQLACGPIGTSRLPASKVRAKVASAQKRLAEAQVLLNEIEFELDYVTAILSLPDHYAFRARENGLSDLVADLSSVAEWLEANKPPAKWTATLRRQHRVRLAVLLKPLFEEQFGEQARPVGGSAAVADADSNDWTRFFQMAASIFFGESTTPDRQALLWEANWPPLQVS